MDSPQSSPSPAPPASSFLFSEMEDPKDERTWRDFASTGERLKAQRPEIYAQVVQCLGQGMGVREICRRLGVHHRTIAAVSIAEGQTIDTMRKELGARALGVAGLALERLEEQIMSGSVKPAELSMAVGILVDKGQVLTGGVTGRVERLERKQVEKDLDAILADAEVVESDTGLGAVEIGKCAVGPAVAGMLGGGLSSGLADSGSDDLDRLTIVQDGFATGSATGMDVDGARDRGVDAGDSEAGDQGGGGGRTSAGGVNDQIGGDSGKF